MSKAVIDMVPLLLASQGIIRSADPSFKNTVTAGDSY